MRRAPWFETPSVPDTPGFNAMLEASGATPQNSPDFQLPPWIARIRPGSPEAAGFRNAPGRNVPIPATIEPIERLIQNSPPSASDQQKAISVVNIGAYGDCYTIAITFAAGGGEILALRRANQLRTSLLIQNLTIVGNLFYAFDRSADGTTCVALVNLGTRAFDSAVPQGDLHLFSGGAGVAVIEYMNKNISGK